MRTLRTWKMAGSAYSVIKTVDGPWWKFWIEPQFTILKAASKLDDCKEIIFQSTDACAVCDRLEEIVAEELKALLEDLKEVIKQ